MARVLPLLKYLVMRADSQAEPLDGMGDADDELVELAVAIFKMLADATRVRIVLALRDGELSVNTLADVVGKSPAAVSQHLAKLRLAGVVIARHDGNRVFYRLANEHAQELVAGALFQAEHSLDDQPRHHRRTAGEVRP
jgi:DNA-binding transcriptional ArsR family regulator